MTYSIKNQPVKEKEAFEIPNKDKIQEQHFRESNAQKEYNGWTNYTTWNIALNIDNDQYMQEETFRVIKEGEVKNGYELKDWFKQTLEDSENYSEDYRSYKLSDAWSERELDDDVNWVELYNTYSKQIKDNEEYELKKERPSRKEITLEMRNFVKKYTTGKYKSDFIDKKDIFKQIQGTEEDKEAVFKKLEENGEIFQKETNKYQWIGN
jgi:hypothetical protein